MPCQCTCRKALEEGWEKKGRVTVGNVRGEDGQGCKGGTLEGGAGMASGRG